jgi:hypothetical protein
MAPGLHVQPVPLSVFEAIAIGLVVLWLTGIVLGVTLGGLLHLLLVAALIMIIVRSLKSDGDNPSAG